MSFCRFGEADVYVFLAVSGHLECCGCSLGEDWEYRTTDDMIAHLEVHRSRGHHVPEHVFDRLRDERDENDAWIVQRREEESRA